MLLDALSLVGFQEAEPGKSCMNMNSVKDSKKYNASFDAAQTKKKQTLCDGPKLQEQVTKQ